MNDISPYRAALPPAQHPRLLGRGKLEQTARDVPAVSKGLKELVERAGFSTTEIAAVQQKLAVYGRNGQRLVQSVGANLDVTDISRGEI